MQASGTAGVAVLAVAGAGAVLVSSGAGAPGTSTAEPMRTVSISSFRIGGAEDVATAAPTRTDPSRPGRRDDAGRPSPAGRNGVLEVSRGATRPSLQQQAEQQAQRRTEALADLADRAQERADQLAAARWVLPVAGYDVTATFGESGSLWSTVHTGLDFAAAEGTPIVSITTGTVTSTEYDGAYGTKTVVTLDDGTEVWYCHQSSQAVGVGDAVAPGQTIGAVGSTGNVTGPHLHLEVRPAGGDPVDPFTVLSQHGLTP